MEVSMQNVVGLEDTAVVDNAVVAHVPVKAV